MKGRKTGGRLKGTSNKATVEMAAPDALTREPILQRRSNVGPDATRGQ
jgi:hypothetical protein